MLTVGHNIRMLLNYRIQYLSKFELAVSLKIDYFLKLLNIDFKLINSSELQLRSYFLLHISCAIRSCTLCNVSIPRLNFHIEFS